MLRRTHGNAGELVPRLRVGDLEIDVLNRKVVAGERELHLTSLEQALLYLLAANAGVDRHVHALRAKRQDDWHIPRYIETVPGTGYRFVPG